MMVKLAQRYAKATQSSNLKSDEYHTDTDNLAAVALSNEFGAMLFRVKYANDHTSYVRLAEAWEWDVKKRAAIAGWPLHIKDADVSKASLKYWLNDLCPVCGGKGKKKHEFVDALSDDNCETCEGTGKKPVDCEPRIKGYVLAMVTILESMTINAGHMAMSKLASDMEL